MDQLRLATLEANDPTFADDLKKSYPHVDAMAGWLRSQGWTVKIGPRKQRPSVKQMDGFQDWDLEISGRIEIKRKGWDFTCAADYGLSTGRAIPFPTVIVCPLHEWEKADPKPVGHIITSHDLKAFVEVKTRTAMAWNKVQRWDEEKGREGTFLECPTLLCRFGPLPPAVAEEFKRLTDEQEKNDQEGERQEGAHE